MTHDLYLASLPVKDLNIPTLQLWKGIVEDDKFPKYMYATIMDGHFTFVDFHFAFVRFWMRKTSLHMNEFHPDTFLKEIEQSIN